MGSGFLRELEYLGVTARLKRLSDAFSTSIRDLYKAKGLDIEPSWHLVFLMLKSGEQYMLTEIAEAFQMSQPAVTKMIASMMKKGYVTMARDDSDGRKKALRLSSKARRRLPGLETVWAAGRGAIGELLASNKSFLDSLEKLERELERKNFADRALERLEDVGRSG